MSMLVLKAAFALVIAFGSIGGTAALAAESLPDSPLYPLKLTIEEARLSLTNDPVEQAMLQLEFAEERLTEIEDMAQAQRTPDEETMARLQEHLGQSFYLATQTPDDSMFGLLNRARDMAQTQEQAMMQVQDGGDAQVQNVLQQTVQLMARVQEACALGLSDPESFRNEFAQSSQHRFGWDDEMPGHGPGPGECEEPGGCEPAGDQNQYGQDGDPGQHGPGLGECEEPGECEPVGDQNQYGQNDDPGQHGPGSAECEDPGECEPVGDQNQYGQDGDSGQYGLGPGECEEPGECEPAGNQNQYGQDGDPGQHGPGPAECEDPEECEPAGNQNTEQNGPGPSHEEQNREHNGTGPGNDDSGGGQHQEQNGDGSGSSGGSGGSDSSGSGGGDSGGSGGSDQGSGGGSGGRGG